ncbi:MAG TPA: isochorismatase family cysteine hydrolase [Thermoanaerobaculia bacterium]|nr:isochorismatase family cysteine hydrolase [Thermoanaerobaculia bacterium]
MIHIDARPRTYFIDSLQSVGLLVIDMQLDFFADNGFGASLGNDVRNLQPCIGPAQELIRRFRHIRQPIIFTKEAQYPNLADCPLTKQNRSTGPYKIGDPSPLGRIMIRDTRGSDLIDEIESLRQPNDIVIYKPGKDAFWGTDLAGILMNLKLTHLIICGVTTDVCVQTTMREANDRGYVCLLAQDATDSYYPKYKEWTIEMMTSQGGIVGWSATNPAILTGLPQHPAATADSLLLPSGAPVLRVGATA